LPVALLSVLIEKKSFSWQLYGSMAILVTGCVVAAWGNMRDEDPLGIVICIGSVLATAVWTVLSAVIMQSGEKPLDAVSLVFVSGPTCIITLLVFFFSCSLPDEGGNSTRPVGSEFYRITNFAPRAPVPPPQMMVFYLGVAAVLASCYDIVHNHFVKLTSSMNMAIMGNSKLALLIVLSMATLESAPTVTRILGVLVAFAGVVWYSWFKLAEQQAKEKAKTADEKTEPLAKKPSEKTELLAKP